MKNKATNILIDKVSEALLKEEIVCFPTETVMGVAIIAENEQTYNKLVDLKNRPANKVFPFCVLKNQIENYCEVNELQKKIIDKFLPGPLTIILKRKEGVPNFIGNEEGTIAVRVSENEFVNTVLEKIKKPIFLTSANLSGEEVCKDSLEAKDDSLDKKDALDNQVVSVRDINDKLNMDIISQKTGQVIKRVNVTFKC